MRNKIFCYGCRKHKMFFETQAKADNFIRYNSENILEEKGKAPVRSYYCEMCGGYHVTSNPSEEVGERLNQRDHLRIERLTNYKREIEEVKVISSLLSQRLVNIRAHLFFGEVLEAEDLLDICKLDIEELSSHQFRGGGKLTTLKERVEKMFNLLASVKELLILPEEKKMAMISTITTDKDQQTLKVILSNILIIQKIDFLLAENKTLLEEKNTEGVAERIDQCRSMLVTIKRAGKKEMTRKYNALLQEQESLLSKVKAGHKIHKKKVSSVHTEQDKPNIQTQCFEKQEYKTTILSLIERIENIRKALENEDYDTCETLLEISYYMLDELNIEDDNTELIKQHLDKLTIYLKGKENSFR